MSLWVVGRVDAVRGGVQVGRWQFVWVGVGVGTWVQTPNVFAAISEALMRKFHCRESASSVKGALLRMRLPTWEEGRIRKHILRLI